MINRIYVCNLKRSEDRWYFMLGALGTAGFDIKDKGFLRRWNAYDGQDYNDDLEVAQAAVADGYRVFSRYDGTHKRMIANQMAWMWTWNSVMQRVVDIKDNRCMVLVLLDKVIPAPSYRAERIHGIAERIREMDSDGTFCGLQLNRDVDDHGYIPFDDRPNATILRKGWIGRSCLALLVSPRGAQLLQDVFAEFEFGPESIHDVIMEIGRRGCKESEFYEGWWHTTEDVFENCTFFKSVRRGN